MKSGNEEKKAKKIKFKNVYESKNSKNSDSFSTKSEKKYNKLLNRGNKSQPKHKKLEYRNKSTMIKVMITDEPIRRNSVKSERSAKEMKLIEESLILSIKNSEKLDNEKIKLADEIKFKELPDKIMDTDQYGFLKEEEEDKINENKNDNSQNLLKYNARLEKWNYMLNNYENFVKYHYKKLKKRVRKGIPDSLRGYAWQKIINLDEFYEKDLYQKLANDDTTNDFSDMIMIDIDRTFPNCLFFKETLGGGQRQLYKVLLNYSKYNKQVGYVQGMGFITALLLTYMDEERSFFMLHALMKKRGLENVLLPGFPDLKRKLYAFLNLEKKLIPKVYNVFKANEINPFSYASEWFLCLFSRNLKFHSLLRIYDNFMLEGYKIIFRFAIAFLKSAEKDIIECKQTDYFFSITKKFIENEDIDEISKIAFSLPIKKKEITFYEKEYDSVKDNKKNEFIAQL